MIWRSASSHDGNTGSLGKNPVLCFAGRTSGTHVFLAASSADPGKVYIITPKNLLHDNLQMGMHPTANAALCFSRKDSPYIARSAHTLESVVYLSISPMRVPPTNV